MEGVNVFKSFGSADNSKIKNVDKNAMWWQGPAWICSDNKTFSLVPKCIVTNVILNFAIFALAYEQRFNSNRLKPGDLRNYPILLLIENHSIS